MKGIVFDLDETLVDRRGSLNVYARRLFADFSASITVPEDPFIVSFHRLDGNGRVPRGAFFAALAAQLFREVRAQTIKAHFDTIVWVKPLLFDGILDLLQTIRARGRRIGIITNGGVPSQTAKLRNSGLSELIDGAVISAAFGLEKPAPEIFRHMINHLGIDAAQSWFIGDDPRADIWGAKQAGFQTCWVERHTAWPADLIRCHDAHVGNTRLCLEVITRGV